MKQVGIVGATGAVGQEIFSLLEKRKFPLSSLRLFASKQSEGKHFIFQQQKIIVETIDEKKLNSCDLLFFCAGSKVSKEWIPKTKALCIDSSSYFRDQAPLIIPEINPEMIKDHQGILSSPNCAATILLLPLFPLHQKFQAQRIILSTYQAASGGGAKLLNQLLQETKSYFEEKKAPWMFDHPYAFNLYPHNSKLLENGYVEEEIKILEESRKILKAPNLKLSATCIRVPTLRAHAISANIEFEKAFTLKEIEEQIDQMPGVKRFENREKNRFATPFDASCQEEIYCGRFRIDPTQPKTLEFWAVGDQLLKGAALNAVQIAELI